CRSSALLHCSHACFPRAELHCLTRSKRCAPNKLLTATMLSDLKYAWRTLIKAPAFTLVAISTLALGIGANTAIFSVVEGTLLRPLPFPHASRLVRIFETHDESGARGASMNLSDQTVQRWREFGRDIFLDIGAGTGGVATVGLNNGSPAQTVPAARVTSNFFAVLGLAPAQGRTFTAEEDRNGG